MDFEKEVIQASKTTPIMVDFYADWCGPCKMLAPILEIATKEVGIPFIKVNVDSNSGISEVYEVKGIPCVLLFKDGKEVARFTGFKPKPVVLQFIKDSVHIIPKV